MAKCWASILGGCVGQVSREHVVSRTLLSDTVMITGFFLQHERSLSLGKDSFVCKCLCSHHNSLLSPCDAEARVFREVVDWWAGDRQASDGPDLVKSIDGFLLAKWCAKTACNISAVSKKHVPVPFIRYAFSEVDNPAIFFYFLPQLGDDLVVNRDPTEFHWLRDTKKPDRAAVVCYTFGLPFMLSAFDLRGAEAKVCELLNIRTTNRAGQFMNRLQAINVGDGPQKRGTIVFRWQEAAPQQDSA